MTTIVTLLIATLVPLVAAGPVLPARPALSPLQPPASTTAVHCDRFAGPRGSDRRRRGTRSRPFRSVPRLLRALRADETGCLLPGRYHHSDPARLHSRGARLVGLDGRAKVDGAIWITNRATGATIRGLDITASDPTYFIPFKVQADHARIVDNRIRGSRSTTCVLIGSSRRAVGVHIERNWIHHCGRRGKLDHLIYVQNALHTVVRGNVLSDNAGGWGVHLYPDADNSVVEQNVIDGNLGGVIFGGEGSRTSDANVVRANVITLSGPRWNVESSWSGAVGFGNVAYGNCLYSLGPSAPAGIGATIGFLAGPNVVSPRSPYAVRTRDRYRFAASDVCSRLVEPLPPAFGRR